MLGPRRVWERRQGLCGDTHTQSKFSNTGCDAEKTRALFPIFPAFPSGCRDDSVSLSVTGVIGPPLWIQIEIPQQLLNRRT